MISGVDPAEAGGGGLRIINLTAPNMVVCGLDCDMRTYLHTLGDSESDSDRAG
jgi:hypothetical protein